MKMVGDQADMLARLKLVLPRRWFGDETPVLNGLFAGLAFAWAWLYELVAFVERQARISTASGVFLDMAAQDYFGGHLSRRAGEGDAAYGQRIRNNLLAPRATRAALQAMLENLTGRKPVIFEPANISDTNGYNFGRGYNVTGGYGSLAMPFQFFVEAYRPNNTPVSNAGGYGKGPGGYGHGPMYYADRNLFSGTISDTEIYAAIASVCPTASIAWTQISN